MTIDNSGILIDILNNIIDSLVVLTKDEGIKSPNTKEVISSSIFRLKGLLSALKWVHCGPNTNYGPNAKTPCGANPTSPYGANPTPNIHTTFDPVSWNEDMRKKMDEAGARIKEASLRYQKEMEDISKLFQQSK